MKLNAKRLIFALIVPVTLVLGLVFCAWIFRLQTLEQVEVQKERLLYLPGNEQSSFFDSEVNTRFRVLSNFAARLADAERYCDDRIFLRLGISAQDVGFSYVSVVGSDAVLLTDKNEKIDISGYECWKTAMNGGKSVFCEFNYSDSMSFAFAVPYGKTEKKRGRLSAFAPRMRSVVC
ncbi:MAG: hypothetical protein VB064_09650 [Oscillospiraceae bacterium]|nr:hypothetical protein [Oscillospiraceae bacterium]